MITRRGLGAIPLLGIAGPSLAAMPPAGLLRFDVLRNGGRIGGHSVDLRQDGADRMAAIRVEIAVGIGPITVYRYTLVARELWRDERFAAFTSETDDNGTRLSVRAERRTEGVVVEAKGSPRAVLPAESIPMTHWNPQCMRAPLFAPRDGKPSRPNVQARGEALVTLSDGRAIRAEHFTLTGDEALDEWYEPDGTWAAMRTNGRDGSIIEYRRLA